MTPSRCLFLVLTSYWISGGDSNNIQLSKDKLILPYSKKNTQFSPPNLLLSWSLNPVSGEPDSWEFRLTLSSILDCLFL